VTTLYSVAMVRRGLRLPCGSRERYIGLAVMIVSLAASADVNPVIQSMASYATNNDVSFTSLADVKNHSHLMTIVTNSWHS
jgi:hypothetical protein